MKARKQLARTKDATEGVPEDELALVRELHEELQKTGRLGDLPKQSTLAKKAIEFCIRAIARGESDCTCKTKAELNHVHPSKSLCPQCQLALRVLRVFTTIEGLSVRRASIEERFFRDLLEARLSLAKNDDGGGQPINLQAIVREYREAKPIDRPQLIANG